MCAFTPPLTGTNTLYQSAVFDLWSKDEERLNLINKWDEFKKEDITENDKEKFLELSNHFDKENHINNLKKAKYLYQEKLDWVNKKTNLKKELEDIQGNKPIHSIISEEDKENFYEYFNPIHPTKIKQADNFIKAMKLIEKNHVLMELIDKWNKLKNSLRMVDESKIYNICVLNIKSEYQKIETNIECINIEIDKIKKLVEKISPPKSEILSSIRAEKDSEKISMKPRFGATVLELKSLYTYFLGMTALFESIKSKKEKLKYLGEIENIDRLTASIIEAGAGIHKDLNEATKLFDTTMDTISLETNVKKYKEILQSMTNTGYGFEKTLQKMCFPQSTEEKYDKLIIMPIGYSYIIELLNETRAREKKYDRPKKIDSLAPFFKNSRKNKLIPILEIINLIKIILKERSSYKMISLHLTNLEKLVNNFLKDKDGKQDHLTPHEKEYINKGKELIKAAQKDLEAEFKIPDSVKMTC